MSNRVMSWRLLCIPYPYYFQRVGSIKSPSKFFPIPIEIPIDSHRISWLDRLGLCLRCRSPPNLGRLPPTGRRFCVETSFKWKPSKLTWSPFSSFRWFLFIHLFSIVYLHVSWFDHLVAINCTELFWSSTSKSTVRGPWTFRDWLMALSAGGQLRVRSDLRRNPTDLRSCGCSKHFQAVLADMITIDKWI